jgi:hypothetical protein
MFGRNICHQTWGFFKENNQHCVTFDSVLIIQAKHGMFLKRKITKGTKSEKQISLV